ncbi:hypothetical protein F5Y09DRAFT_343658 [Xylaria sp. FL1042]|nr:hypothetical protein F5Y09DRAFT_343658 [Xylaria sp. FL1042]
MMHSTEPTREHVAAIVAFVVAISHPLDQSTVGSGQGRRLSSSIPHMKAYCRGSIAGLHPKSPGHSRSRLNRSTIILDDLGDLEDADGKPSSSTPSPSFRASRRPHAPGILHTRLAAVLLRVILAAAPPAYPRATRAFPFPSGSLRILGAEGSLSPSPLHLSRRQTASQSRSPPVPLHAARPGLARRVLRLRHLVRHGPTARASVQDISNVTSVTYTLVTAATDHAALGPSSQTPLGPIEIARVESYEMSPAQLSLPSGALREPLHRLQTIRDAGRSPRGRELPGGVSGCSDQSRRRSKLDVEDGADGLLDLIPENLTREVNKAAIAFSLGVCEVVWSPLWGCGAFGGDPFVKVALLWCARFRCAYVFEDRM